MAAGTPVLLLVADISGYTRFMLENAVSTSHAREITVRLLHTLVRAARPPLRVAELEGAPSSSTRPRRAASCPRSPPR